MYRLFARWGGISALASGSSHTLPSSLPEAITPSESLVAVHGGLAEQALDPGQQIDGDALVTGSEGTAAARGMYVSRGVRGEGQAQGVGAWLPRQCGSRGGRGDAIVLAAVR